jgi:hypothetical protein
MARRFLAGSLTLIALLTLAITLTRAVAQGQTPQAEAIFTMPDGAACPRLCLFGVVPGETTTEQAANLLRTHPLTRDFELISNFPFRIEGHNDWIMMISFNTSSDGIVDEITLARYIRYGQIEGDRLIPLPDPGVLGDALNRFGSPDFVQLTQGGDPSLIFANAGVITNLVRTRGVAGRIVLNQPLSRLTLFRNEACTDSAFDYSFLRWLGAAQLRRYSFSRSITRAVRRMNSAGATFAPCRQFEK